MAPPYKKTTPLGSGFLRTSNPGFTGYVEDVRLYGIRSRGAGSSFARPRSGRKFFEIRIFVKFELNSRVRDVGVLFISTVINKLLYL